MPPYLYRDREGHGGEGTHAPAHARAIYYVFAFMDSPM